MSLYLAFPSDPSISQSVSLSVKDKGLSFLRAKPSDVQVVVLPAVVQPGYANYTKNLPAFMEATLSRNVTAICNRGYPISDVPYMLPWTLPSLIYSFSKPPKDTTIEQLKRHSDLIEGRGRAKCFVMRDVTIDKVRTLVAEYGADLNRTTPHIIGTVNLEALKMVIVIQKILSAFLLTHAYPAFRHNVDVEGNEDDKCPASKKRKVSPTTPETHTLSDTRPNIGTNDDEEETVDGSETTRHDTVVLTRAKPTPILNDKWGSVDTMPNTSGLYVPYVKELAVGDTLTLPNLIATHFVRSLASTPDAIFAQMELVRAAWGIIHTTSLGHEISHISKCIDIAIQAQAAVYPIYHNDLYEGTIICGAGYSISIRGGCTEPVAYDRLQDLVRNASAHSKALSEIKAHMGELHGSLLDRCRTMRAVSKLVLGIGWDEFTKQEIVKSAHNLSYTGRYWSTSISNVKTALTLLSDPTKIINDDVPLHPKFLFSMDRTEQVLCAFGHQAPTFMIPNGQRCDLAKDPPKNLHVRTTTVFAAVSDMKYVLENGYVTNNATNLSSKYRDQALKSNDKSEVWKLLQMCRTSAIERDDEEETGTATLPSGKTTGDNIW